MGRHSDGEAGHGNHTAHHMGGGVVDNHHSASEEVVEECDAHRDRAHSNHGGEEANARGNGLLVGCNRGVGRGGHNRRSRDSGAWGNANGKDRASGAHRSVESDNNN